MKAIKINQIKSDIPVKAIDCFVDKGYIKTMHGSLPDVDSDFASDRRQDVKAYIERRYNHDGKQRVFSAGTFTTLKAKAVIKDVARTMRIPHSMANYYTGVLEDLVNYDWTELFKYAANVPKFGKFIKEYPQLFEDIRTLMDQPRSSSIHASALLVTPDEMDGEDMECFDFVPIKKVDGILVSENSGYDLDELGLLKNDCLATKELSKLHDTLKLIKNNYGQELTLEELVKGDLDDAEVFHVLSEGYTQNVFQMSSRGMTKFLQEMRPTNIRDLIAANALYRPATLESGSSDTYVNCKNGLVAPQYLWGTYNAMKNTYGVLCYQEQLAQVAREVGGFSLGEGVKLVKFISKKKKDKIAAMKEKFLKGAAKNGCPDEHALAIWQMFEAAGSYLFNSSHATAYAITAYVGAWLKVHYPTAFYTVALQWAKEDQLPTLMSEINSYSKANIVPPEINHSNVGFYTDFETDSIFWSLTRIKFIGLPPVEYIVAEREKRGPFTSLEDFINRIFKYKLGNKEYWDNPDNADEGRGIRNPVTSRMVTNLILAGCFDKIENVQDITDRYRILTRAAEILDFDVSEINFPKDQVSKPYFWSRMQVAVSGIGAVDYRKAYDGSKLKEKHKSKVPWMAFEKATDPILEGKRVAICATVISKEERQYVSKMTGKTETFCKLMLQQNQHTMEMVIWPEEYQQVKFFFEKIENQVLAAIVNIKYSDYNSSNNFQLTRQCQFEIL